MERICTFCGEPKTDAYSGMYGWVHMDGEYLCDKSFKAIFPLEALVDRFFDLMRKQDEGSAPGVVVSKVTIN